MKSIKGLLYKPFDNSGSINLSSYVTKYTDTEFIVGNEKELSGTSSSEAKIVKIISDPFLIKARLLASGKFRETEYVIVEEDDGDCSMVLFDKKYILFYQKMKPEEYNIQSDGWKDAWSFCENE